MLPRRLLGRLRRRVLAHRRLLAGLLAALAVVAALRSLAPAPPPTVALTVASRDLAAGAHLAEADLETRRVPADSAPAGAVRRPAGATLAGGVRRGEPITDVRLVGAALVSGDSDRVAVPVRLPDPAMAALLHAGDRIDLLAVDPSGGEPEQVADGALVLAVPPEDRDDSGVTSGLGGRLVIIGVAPSEVTDVAQASVRLFLTVAYAR